MYAARRSIMVDETARDGRFVNYLDSLGPPPVGWSGMNRILVIGETGTIGRQVVSRLAASGAQVRAMARNPGAARFAPQVEVVRGDVTLTETLDGCLNGVDGVFLVWSDPATAVTPALERIAKHA
jgi:NAD(P)-dependent dehydrogenase (short-subunit alcohol dehydrogenase family)